LAGFSTSREMEPYMSKLDPPGVEEPRTYEPDSA